MQNIVLSAAVDLKDYPEAFILFMDERRLCFRCPGAIEDCVNHAMMRPCHEYMAVDVFSAARRQGLPIPVLEGRPKR